MKGPESERRQEVHVMELRLAREETNGQRLDYGVCTHRLLTTN